MAWCGLKQPKEKKNKLGLISRGRVKFKADYGDGKRKRRLSDAEVWRRARECQRKLIAEATPEELETAAILRRLGVVFEFQKIFQNGDSWIIVDFFVPSVQLVIELDGRQHRENKKYDHSRSTWLVYVYRVKIVRFWNSAVWSGLAEQRIREMLGFGNLR